MFNQLFHFHGYQFYATLNRQRSDARQPLTNTLQRLLDIITGQCPLQDDISHPTQMRLKSRKPLWYDMQPIDITHCWCQDWSTTSVVNHDLAKTLLFVFQASVCHVHSGAP